MTPLELHETLLTLVFRLSVKDEKQIYELEEKLTREGIDIGVSASDKTISWFVQRKNAKRVCRALKDLHIKRMK